MRAILMYHSIDPSGSPVSMERASFERQADWLAAGRVRVAPLAELVELADDEDAVAITFDDGFASFGSLAWPILAERGLPATVFVVSDHAGGTNAWGGRSSEAIPDLPLLGWDELARLAEEGAEIGGHSRTHARLDLVDPQRLRAELWESRERIAAETGRVPTSFAYPYGCHGAAAVAAAREAYERAVTTDHRLLRSSDDRHRLPRIDASYLAPPGRLEGFGSARFRFLVRALDLRVRARLARDVLRGTRH